MAERSLNRKRLRRWPATPARSPRNRRRAKPALVAGRVLLGVLAAQGLWTLFHAPQLKLRRIDVVGTERLGARRVAELASIPLGRNVFRVNLFRARVAVEQDPLVESASVTRALPDAVRIVVHERRPVFTVAYAGRYLESDGAGVLFRSIAKPTPRLPLLTVRNVGPLHLGQRLPDGVTNPALACLRITARDRMPLREISIDGPHELWLNMKVPSGFVGAQASGPAAKSLRLRLGRPENLAEKLEDARKILAGRPQILEDARYLDVSCAGRPVYMAQTPTGPSSLVTRSAASPAATAVLPVIH